MWLECNMRTHDSHCFHSRPLCVIMVLMLLVMMFGALVLVGLLAWNE